MAALRRYVVISVSFVISIALTFGQQRKVDASHTYERLWAVVPLVGAGTVDDPIRPKYAPVPGVQSSAVRTGILGFQFIKADDGLALVQYVGANQAAFAEILADPSVITFQKGRASQAALEAEFLKHIKTFDFAHFGVRMP